MLIVGPGGLILKGPGRLSVLDERSDDDCCRSHCCPGDGDAGCRLAVPGFRAALRGGSTGGHRRIWLGNQAGTEMGRGRCKVALASVCAEGHLDTLDGGADVVAVSAPWVGTVTDARLGACWLVLGNGTRVGRQSTLA